MRAPLLALLLLLACRPAAAQVDAALVPGGRVEAGEPVRVTLRLSIAPGWHVYARDPGEVGLPTAVSWRGPVGLRLLRVDWPPSTPRLLPGGAANTLEGEVEIVATLLPPPDLEPGEGLEIGAEVSWGACREVCIPQRVELSARVPPR